MLHRHLLPISLRRWPVWAFALALLLKAAVPLLATAAAQAQGKTLVEICTVYGVSTVAIDNASPPIDADTGKDHGAAHGGEHCVLSGVLLGAALDAPPIAPVLLHAPARNERPAPSVRQPSVPDACADWAARLRHGPPAFA